MPPFAEYDDDQPLPKWMLGDEMLVDTHRPQRDSASGAEEAHESRAADFAERPFQHHERVYRIGMSSCRTTEDVRESSDPSSGGAARCERYFFDRPVKQEVAPLVRVKEEPEW
ncbi:unnamed protein product [Vitrella brassicaformis CCMP3155]|nr:unnamed protein product [Vitrella brassicaformis CCMP3155]|eukprot:CEM29798.1 unnamed protein product [Vitrella brassicaformis CCMP3155]